MMLKWLFDRLMAFFGLLFLWPVLLVVAILIKINMSGPVLFVQQRVGKDGKLFNCHKFRSMSIGHNGSSISAARRQTTQIQTRRTARTMGCTHWQYVLCRASSRCTRLCRQTARRRPDHLNASTRYYRTGYTQISQ